jgi:hypothetical protein
MILIGLKHCNEPHNHFRHTIFYESMMITQYWSLLLRDMIKKQLILLSSLLKQMFAFSKFVEEQVMMRTLRNHTSIEASHAESLLRESHCHNTGKSQVQNSTMES